MANLSSFGLRACPKCYHVWKPLVSRPLRCPRCRYYIDIGPYETDLPSEIVLLLNSDLPYFQRLNLYRVIECYLTEVCDWRQLLDDISS